MPLETFRGPNVAALLAEAQATLGAEAVILAVDRIANGSGFELLAGDPESARTWNPNEASFPVRLTCFSPHRSDLVPHDAGPAVVALVGPTGAGKTTTLAKLATHPAVFGGLEVGFLGLDTFRIGALEQLRIYADLAGVPCEVAYEPGDVPRALRRLADREIVLVDTVGRGPTGLGDLDATRELLRAIGPDEVHLVLPAGLQPKLARRVIEQHRSGGITHLLVTKLDEFPEEEKTLDLADRLGLPMRWVADGQGVPLDLRSAQVWRCTPEPRHVEALTAEAP